jgi:hypothetical protein
MPLPVIIDSVAPAAEKYDNLSWYSLLLIVEA